MTHSINRWTGLLALLALPLATNTVAAEVKAWADGIKFQPENSAPAYQLRLIGPQGQVFESSFLADEVMQVGSEKLGGNWVDGSYRFEISPIIGMAVRHGDQFDPEEKRQPSMPSESGAFRIVNGLFQLPGDGSVEAQVAVKANDDSDLPTRDQVIPDDLIVQGSICAGFDCVNNESFGFDTLRLKENNTRIKFEDTSSTGSFPSSDWQLTANDSASGGLNKFSIEDITAARVPFTIEGGSPSNSLYVDDTGRIGLRTNTPVLDLHMATGNTPGLRLEQNSSSGFTAQTWDVAGNEANFFVRDVTGGSLLPFRIFPGAATNSLTVAANGNVGIGTNTPAQKLEMTNAGPVAFDLNNTAGARWRVRSGNGNNLVFVAPDDATAAAEFTLDTAGNLTIAGNFFALGGTQINVPDYVFKPEYKLMPLDELATFIETNRHLPNVRSESEVAEAGKLNMTELQLKLLEKVEELTLYTLDQHRQIKALEQQVQELKAR